MPMARWWTLARASRGRATSPALTRLGITSWESANFFLFLRAAEQKRATTIEGYCLFKPALNDKFIEYEAVEVYFSADLKFRTA